MGADRRSPQGVSRRKGRDGTTAPPPSNARAAPRQGEVVYFVFDLLYLEGRDLMESPLAARKQALRRLLGASGAGPLRYADHVEGSWEEVLEKGCRLALKGIVSKRIDAPYVPGRGSGWVVASCGGARHGTARKKITPALQRAPGQRA
ncbi:ATP-dependent DNA ligase [Sorangium sp. So ce854]|uniref:ATP-dependent DNA ligase n=1 Tax=Sorangium sp. So ce854 TaxID=3133322 RepID=UPI003F62C06C